MVSARAVVTVEEGAGAVASMAPGAMEATYCMEMFR